MTYFFKYKVKWYDDTDHCEKVGMGLVVADSYAGAAKELETWYDLISIETLYSLEEGAVYDFDLMNDDNVLFTITPTEKEKY